MRYTVSETIRSVHPPPISEVKRWIAGTRHTDLIDLCQAVPDYPPAPALTDHLGSILNDPQTSRYSPDEGLPEVREAVCARYERRYGARISPDQICLTIGASQAFWLAVVTLCRAGDRIIVQSPCYFDHPMALDMLGIGSTFAPFSEDRGGIPSPETIERLISPRTRAILIVTPSNPTGVVIPPTVIHDLLEVAKRHRIALILDETYSDFIPGGARPHDIFTDEAWSDNFIHIMSFGKTYALTGYRAGMLAASAEFVQHALKAQDSMAVCQPRVTQHAVQFGVNHLEEWVGEKRLMMERRHDRFRSEFSTPGNPFSLVASGTFFAWVRHPYAGKTGREVAKRLVEESGVLTLPGEVFGPGLEPYLRLAFGNIGEEAIPEAVARFRSFPA
ncbi:aminotransferase [Geobacter sp. DSM 9736]|uniref:aminotransferase n=1 Tax=Geobacter sp. DSM 9736 TaxID=1277350 RepID=UPI000B4FF4C1|nr:aminotransferase [Geobacter sp. DSM 9736]SNB46816.1 hypothetical protein SAMN06269301_2286 [Geobacter sp. DSM 9736]